MHQIFQVFFADESGNPTIPGPFFMDYEDAIKIARIGETYEGNIQEWNLYDNTEEYKNAKTTCKASRF